MPTPACKHDGQTAEREHIGMPGGFYLDWDALRVESQLVMLESGKMEPLLDLTLRLMEREGEPFRVWLTAEDAKVLLHQLTRYVNAMTTLKSRTWFDAETVMEANR
ncbi:hypothetical protein [Lapillicoccus jejuensis]|uniref:Uncharacterized protein n=1 Tax=Lapillicoccus jejuensis TaxID=402171 RepID=A0A542DVV2_9MICO|nr:hypothetical protein [Lapillicoccus jejuensis]TQJ07239.1 hypothetical protein FB458_0297 [Lapillicoccus jejuensis]